MTVGVYPGSFNPPTIAHLHIAEVAHEQLDLERIDLVLSAVTLGKDADELADLAERQAALEALAATRPWLGVRVVDSGLLVNIAEDYDVLIVGADKWAQVIDPVWYGSVNARNDALARLPLVAVAPRPPAPLPGPNTHTVVLDTDSEHHSISATGVRDGRHDWAAPVERRDLGPWLAGEFGAEADTRPPRRPPMSDVPPDIEGVTEAVERVVPHRVALADAAEQLEHAVTSAAGDERAWRKDVAVAVVSVGDALAGHIDEVEADDGLYVEIVGRTPRLSHDIERLRRDHDDMRERLAELAPMVSAPIRGPEQVEAIREKCLDLLGEISRHRHRGADLIFNSYDWDIGDSE